MQGSQVRLLAWSCPQSGAEWHPRCQPGQHHVPSVISEWPHHPRPVCPGMQGQNSLPLGVEG